MSKKYYACKETLDIYMLAHSGDRTRTIFMRHITNSCSSKVLRGPTPGVIQSRAPEELAAGPG